MDKEDDTTTWVSTLVAELIGKFVIQDAKKDELTVLKEAEENAIEGSSEEGNICEVQLNAEMEKRLKESMEPSNRMKIVKTILQFLGPKDSVTTSGTKVTYQLTVSGGFDKALKVFENFNPKNIKDLENNSAGKMKLGDIKVGTQMVAFKLIVREKNSEGSPTIEFQRGKLIYMKIRYHS